MRYESVIWQLRRQFPHERDPQLSVLALPSERNPQIMLYDITNPKDAHRVTTHIAYIDEVTLPLLPETTHHLTVQRGIVYLSHDAEETTILLGKSVIIGGKLEDNERKVRGRTSTSRYARHYAEVMLLSTPPLYLYPDSNIIPFRR